MTTQNVPPVVLAVEETSVVEHSFHTNPPPWYRWARRGLTTSVVLFVLGLVSATCTVIEHRERMRQHSNAIGVR